MDEQQDSSRVEQDSGVGRQDRGVAHQDSGVGEQDTWCWQHPPSVADFDGDGLPEASINGCGFRSVMRITPAGPDVMWFEAQAWSHEYNSSAVGSAFFDLLGEGPVWAAYDVTYSSSGDLSLFRYPVEEAFSHVGGNFAWGFTSPVVADVDNDGSADFVLIRRESTTSDSVVVYQDGMRSPSPARRVFNQYDYFVTNVREDGTIPAHPVMPWQRDGARTYRAQGRLGCAPPVIVP